MQVTSGLKLALDHPVVLAVAPLLGYLVAYLGRLGEAAALGIPADFIALSITDVLSRTSLVALFVALLILAGRLETWLRSRTKPWARSSVETGTTWLLFAGSALIFGSSLRMALYICGLGVAYSLIWGLGGFLRRKTPSPRRIAQYERTAKAAEKLKSASWFALARVLFLGVVVLSASFVGGNMRATNTTRHLVDVEDSSVVVLAVYSDSRVVLGRLEQDGATLTSTRWFMPLSGESAYQWKETGAISWPDGLSLVPLERLYAF